MSKENDDAFLDATRNALDNLEETQSPDIARALTAARKQALIKKPKKRDSSGVAASMFKRTLLPTGLTAIGLLIFTLWFPTDPINKVPTATPELLSFETLDLLSAEEDLDLYEELEFINWLSRQAKQG